MNKKVYTLIELELLMLGNEDVITTSRFVRPPQEESTTAPSTSQPSTPGIDTSDDLPWDFV